MIKSDGAVLPVAALLQQLKKLDPLQDRDQYLRLARRCLEYVEDLSQEEYSTLLQSPGVAKYFLEKSMLDIMNLFVGLCIDPKRRDLFLQVLINVYKVDSKSVSDFFNNQDVQELLPWGCLDVLVKSFADIIAQVKNKKGDKYWFSVRLDLAKAFFQNPSSYIVLSRTQVVDCVLLHPEILPRMFEDRFLFSFLIEDVNEDLSSDITSKLLFEGGFNFACYFIKVALDSYYSRYYNVKSWLKIKELIFQYGYDKFSAEVPEISDVAVHLLNDLEVCKTLSQQEYTELLSEPLVAEKFLNRLLSDRNEAINYCKDSAKLRHLNFEQLCRLVDKYPEVAVYPLNSVEIIKSLRQDEYTVLLEYPKVAEYFLETSMQDVKHLIELNGCSKGKGLIPQVLINVSKSDVDSNKVRGFFENQDVQQLLPNECLDALVANFYLTILQVNNEGTSWVSKRLDLAQAFFRNHYVCGFLKIDQIKDCIRLHPAIIPDVLQDSFSQHALISYYSTHLYALDEDYDLLRLIEQDLNFVFCYINEVNNNHGDYSPCDFIKIKDLIDMHGYAKIVKKYLSIDKSRTYPEFIQDFNSAHIYLLLASGTNPKSIQIFNTEYVRFFGLDWPTKKSEKLNEIQKLLKDFRKMALAELHNQVSILEIQHREKAIEILKVAKNEPLFCAPIGEKDFLASSPTHETPSHIMALQRIDDMIERERAVSYVEEELEYPLWLDCSLSSSKP